MHVSETFNYLYLSAHLISVVCLRTPTHTPSYLTLLILLVRSNGSRSFGSAYYFSDCGSHSS